MTEHDPLRQQFVGDERRLVILDGIPWEVYEHIPEYDRRASPTLVFESEGVVRRVRDFPADWRERSDAELYALSWRR